MASELEGTTEVHRSMQERLTESVEEIKEEISQQHVQEKKERRWLNQVSLTTALLAALASIVAMRGNSLANEAMLAQLKANDQWAYFQAKATKRHVDMASITLLKALEKPIPKEAAEKINQLSLEQKKIQHDAQDLETQAEKDLDHHEHYAYSVVALQIGISLSAIAALLRKRGLWYMSLLLALIGILLIGI